MAIRERRLKLNEKRTEMKCQNLFAGRIVQNVVEIIILFLLFSYHNLKIKYVHQLSGKTVLSVFDLLGLRDLIFKKLDFLCLLELWGLLFIKF